MTDKHKAITFKPSWWARFFRKVQPTYKRITLQASNINIQSVSIQNTIPYDKVIEIRKDKQSYWYRVHLHLSPETTIVLGGLKSNDAQKLCSNFSAYKNTPAIEILYLWLQERENGNHWVSHYDIECATAKTNILNEVLKHPNTNLTDNHTLNKMILSIKNFSSDPNGFRALSNEKFIPLELRRFKNYFDSVESEPLTISQRQAIITHEDNTLVIAGAGSGRTSVIVAKAGYLIEKGIYNEDEILLVAFNKSAADEITERIRKRIRANVRSTTFHALGLGIISEVDKKKPSLAKTAENDRSLKQKIQDILSDLLLEDKSAINLVTMYFQSYFAPYKSAFDFKELGDYYKYVKDNELIS